MHNGIFMPEKKVKINQTQLDVQIISEGALNVLGFHDRIMQYSASMEIK